MEIPEKAKMNKVDKSNGKYGTASSSNLSPQSGCSLCSCGVSNISPQLVASR